MLYHKIDSVYLRDPNNNHKTFLEGEWARPEFGYLADLKWDWTEKIDGTNIRINLHTGEIGGRTERAEIPAFLLPTLEEIRDRAATVPDLTDTQLVLYGEGCGPKIQSGKMYGDTHRFVLFDVYAQPAGIFLARDDVEDIGRTLDIPVVPILDRGTLPQAILMCRFDPPQSKIGEGHAEGFVLRPHVELRDRQGERIITKVKVRDF